MDISYYIQKFADIPVDKKRDYLISHPFIRNNEKSVEVIKTLPDEKVHELYAQVYGVIESAIDDLFFKVNDL